MARPARPADDGTVACTKSQLPTADEEDDNGGDGCYYDNEGDGDDIRHTGTGGTSHDAVLDADVVVRVLFRIQ